MHLHYGSKSEMRAMMGKIFGQIRHKHQGDGNESPAGERTPRGNALKSWPRVLSRRRRPLAERQRPPARLSTVLGGVVVME